MSEHTFVYSLNEVYDYVDDIEVEVPEALSEFDQFMAEKVKEFPGAVYQRGDGDSYEVTVVGTDLQVLELMKHEFEFWGYTGPGHYFRPEATLKAIQSNDLSLRPDGKMPAGYWANR